MARIGTRITVSGRVQGVGFRWMTKMVADKLHIAGTVENLDNGDVYIEAIGESDMLARFTAAIKASPTPSGRVDNFTTEPLSPLPNWHDFRVVG
ncbi:acylphosphatase [Lacticaseibacillus brantae]|nr:acylphosphatase [Lacticaseibacillus brantae]